MTTQTTKFGKSKSKVISVKLPLREYNRIGKYNDIGLQNNQEYNFKQVNVIDIVNNYINLEDYQKKSYHKQILQVLHIQGENSQFYHINIDEDDFKRREESTIENIGKISIRINKELLNEWDQYCEKHFLTRTGLIRAALYEFFSPEKVNQPITRSEHYRISQLLEAIFSGFGPIEEHRIFLLFNHFERAKIVESLNQLESEGKIGRKVTEQNRTIYVPSGLIEDSGEDPYIARIFDRLL